VDNRKLLWTKMDVHIDSDPRVVRSGDNASTVVSIYLFVHRLAFIDGCNDGILNPHRIDPWYLSRMLFIPIETARSGIAACMDVRLLQLSSHGVIVTGRYDRDGWLYQISEADQVLITDWGPDYSFRPLSEAERQKRARDKRLEKRKFGRDLDASRESRESRQRHDRHGIEQSNTDLEHKDQISLVPDASGTVDTQTDDGGLTKQQIRALKIPDRAWWAADSLRRMVIARNPSANIAAKPWDGKPRPANAVDELQDIAKNPHYRGKYEVCALERSGTRMKWAETMRKLNEIDKRSWDEIRETMLWLQNGQPAKLGTGFIVESPEALREKFGAIAMHIAEGKKRGFGGSGSSTDGVAKAVAEMQAALGKDGAR